VRNGTLRNNQDFEALGALVETLNRIASLELKQTAGNPQVGAIDLSETLNDLRIVLEPYCQEADIEVRWDIPPALPAVWADPHSLLQVLLNLTKNSRRALAAAATKRIDVSAASTGAMATIRVTDSGPGIPSPEILFQPFQKGAESTGLGLYLSRAFLRSFHGELRHDPAGPGCSFVIELELAGAGETGFERAVKHDAHKTLTA
jgi:C4-dicarboxylate-specific signal transduction histidine kinase